MTWRFFLLLVFVFLFGMFCVFAFRYVSSLECYCVDEGVSYSGFDCLFRRACLSPGGDYVLLSGVGGARAVIVEKIG